MRYLILFLIFYTNWVNAAVLPEKVGFENINDQVNWTPKFSNKEKRNWQNNWFLDGLKTKITNSNKGLLFSVSEADGNVKNQIHLASDISLTKPSIIKTVTYKQEDGVNLNLTCYYPEGYQKDKKYPTILLFFGGGWTSGTVKQLEPQAQYFIKRGMIAILANYRVFSRNKTTPFDALKDAKSAFNYIVENNNELGIDISKIVISGASAGGHLAAACDLTPSNQEGNDQINRIKPAALVLFNPVIDNGPGGYGYERIGERYLEISPLHNIKKGAAPTIMFFGDNDQHVPVSTIKLYKQKLKEVGTLCKLYIYKGQKHGFFNYNTAGDNKYFNLTIMKADDFLSSLKIIEKSK